MASVTRWLFTAFCVACIAIALLALAAKYDFDQRYPCLQYGERHPLVSGKVVVFVASCIKRQGLPGSPHG